MENEAIKVLVTQKQCIEKSSSGQCKINCGDCKKNIPIAYQEKSYEVAISALREILQYREIGTVEECREAVEKQKWQKYGTEGQVNRMKRTYENCSLQKRIGRAGKDGNGMCMGFGRSDTDDEPCEICKKCKLYTGNEGGMNE